jgi:hypothetical protein
MRHLKNLSAGRAALGLALCASCGLLTSCSGSGGPQSWGVTGPSAPEGSAARAGSWMSPDAKRADLLYVSDLNANAVVVYDYKTGTQVGLLTGFAEPAGQCVDAQGDVWITNAIGDQVMEYAHGGIAPLQVLTTDGSGVGCSIDPRTGDLAVANSFSSLWSTGDIQIFKHASGTPADYTNAVACGAFYPPGYDDKGNLYFEAVTGSYRVCELAAGANEIVAVDFPQTIAKAGSVMWDGRHITIAVPDYHGTAHTVIYQAKRHGTGKLTVAGTTILSDACNGADALVTQPFIVGKKNTPVNVERGTTIVGANSSCSRRFDRWAYPAGRQPARSGDGPAEVGGNAVSLATRAR